MKEEARVLVTGAYSGWVAALVVRGRSLDGVVVAGSCAGACFELAEAGYMGELRYALGPCTCGLPSPPRVTPELEGMKALALSIARSAAELEGRLRGGRSGALSG